MTVNSTHRRERWRWRGGGIADGLNKAGQATETNAGQANGREDKSMKSRANTTATFQFCATLKRSISAIAATAVLAAGSVMPAFADVTNTATATGSSPTGTNDVTGVSNTVAVDPIDATSSLTIVKNGVITTDGDSDGEGDVGDVVTYTYTVTNTGTTTLSSVDIVDTHDGDGPAPAPTFASFTTQAGSPAATAGDTSITMFPGAVAEFTATYTITAGDIVAAGGTGVGLTVDNDIDNSAVASGDYFNGVVTSSITSPAGLESIPLDIDAALSVAKAAYEGGLPPALGGTGTLAAADRPAGTVITYVYTITNTGNVPATTVGLSDVHDGLGSFSQPTFNSIVNTSGNSINDDSIDGNPNQVDRLYPADVAYYTTTYTITQDDVDQRQ
jgi:hypothetical protein